MITGAAVATAVETHSIPSPSAVVGGSRTVRLFGVNLECQMEEDDGDDSVAAATAAVESPPDGYYGQNMYYYYSPHPHNMVILRFYPFKSCTISDSNLGTYITLHHHHII